MALFFLLLFGPFLIFGACRLAMDWALLQLEKSQEATKTTTITINSANLSMGCTQFRHIRSTQSEKKEKRFCFDNIVFWCG